VTCLKLSTLKVCAEIESSVDLVEKAELLRLAQQNLRYLNEDEKRSQILSTLIEIYEKFGNDTSLDYNEKVKFIERAVNLSYEMDDTARTTTLKLQLAKITEIQAQQVLSEKSFDSELVAAHLYIKAAKIYLEIGFDTNYTELFSKAVDLYPDLDLEDLQISTVGS
jgi:tetratricopeptide (TPR) repeat protein